MPKTTLRILDDITGTSREIQVDETPQALFYQLISIRRTVRRVQKLINLTVHLRPQEIRLHWWTDDPQFLDCIIQQANLPAIAEKALLERKEANHG